MKKNFKKYAAAIISVALIASLSTTVLADDYYYQDSTEDYDYGDTYNGYEVYYGDSDSNDYYYDDSTDYYTDDSTDYYQDDSTDYYQDDSTDYYQDTMADDTTDYYSDDSTSDSSSSDSTESSSAATTDSTDSTSSTSDSTASSSSSSASSKSASTTPTPNISVPSPGNNFYILDQAGVVSSSVVTSIQSQGEELYKATGAQVVVVTIKSTNGVSLKDYAYTLFNKWSIGGDSGYGVLVLLATDDNLYYTMSGKGVMNSVDNTVLSNLNTTYLEPYFAEKNYSDGVDAIYPQIVTKVKAYMERSGNAVAQTDTSSSSSETSSDSSESQADTSATKAKASAVISVIVKILVFLLIVIALIAGVFVWRRLSLKKLNAANRGNQSDKRGKTQGQSGNRRNSASSASSRNSGKSNRPSSSSASRRANRRTPPPSAPIKPRRNK